MFPPYVLECLRKFDMATRAAARLEQSFHLPSLALIPLSPFHSLASKSGYSSAEMIWNVGLRVRNLNTRISTVKQQLIIRM